jgi:putative toxin-antitoxin system antitoxin component (TIGR02293 family)
MIGSEYVVDVLGGPGVFRGRTTLSAAELRAQVKRGLPYRAFESVRERLGLSVSDAAGVLQLPPRTLARRRQTRRLAADESDRLFRLARVAAQAVSVLGSEEKASAWLQRPNRALGGEAPLRLLDTDVGARQIEDVLGRIEHGVVG